MLASAVLALALAAAPAPDADLVDLLDFDQGTLLVAEPPSDGADVSQWSAFRASDGDPAEGWCSAEGKPLGGEFVYELAGDAVPATFRVSAAGVQEDAYAGVSVRGVELWTAGATGPFTKLATLEVPKGGTKQVTLPAGKPVRKVKVVIKSNWGNATYTELMELDLLGKWVAPPPAFDASGDYWSETWNGFRLKQTGSHVEGCYDYAHGTFSGELEGRVAKGSWRETGDDGADAHGGKATFILSAEKKVVRGVYFNDEGKLAGVWDLRKPEPDEVVKCQPRGSSLAERLRKDGRLALYGIHFDSNSDVPRPDSEPTLQQLLDLLQTDAALKLQVEGHTDSTNTDAYNLDLSDRRAKAVVKWLADHGIPAARLTPRGIGRAHPVASNQTSQGRALNRRVEVALPDK